MDSGTGGTIGTGYYVGIGYDDHLRRITALSTDITTGFEFDTQNDRDIIRKVHMGTAIIGSAQIEDASITNAKIANLAVTSAKINDFSFNQGTGGTLTLGGTNNGNGLLNVQNQAGANIVTLNNTGMTVTDGSILIQNSSGSSVIDSNGVNSLTNFQSNAFVLSGTQTITNTESDINNTTGTIIVGRSSKYLFITNVNADLVYGGTTAKSNIVYFNLDGTNQDPVAKVNGFNGDGQNTILKTTYGLTHLVTLDPGTHVVKLRLKNDNAGGANISDASLVYVALGL